MEDNMKKRVMKKGGNFEPFNPEKIKNSISHAIQNLNLAKEKKDEMVEKVFSEVIEFLKDKKEIATVEIEAKILLELDKLAPEAAKIWREYRIKKERV